MKQSDVHRELARIMGMCEGAEVELPCPNDGNMVIPGEECQYFARARNRGRRNGLLGRRLAIGNTK